MLTNLKLLLAYLPMLPALLRLKSDVQADIADPTEENLNATIEDAEAIAAKIFPNVPTERVEAGAAIAMTLVTLESRHDVKDIEADIVVIAHQLPTLLAMPNSTQEKIDNLAKALLAFQEPDPVG
jgi:hypothetical protein